MNYKLKSMILFPMNVLYSISPRLELKIMFFLKQKYRLNLEKPVTYNEKLNWQKLYYHNEDMSICSDKYLVRKYVSDHGCGDILNTLLWQGYNPEAIPFSKLPEQFVIKATHGSGFNIICRNKSELNINEIVPILKSWLNTKYIKCYGESWYGRLKPRIIVESFIESEPQKDLFDYKFFCFDGEPEYVYVDTWKDGKHHINMYDVNFNLLKNVSLGYPTDMSDNICKPENFKEMLEVARKLSGNFPHVRIDLYSVSGKIIFGEMTFSKEAGFDRILPYEFDVEMGKNFNVIRKKDF
ncbi:MAG: hypothetical protein EUB_02387 [Eubacterium sp.]|uniref:ATP-grasp fold amidoligase family protein n=1 Tax=Eubacterium sp. TaxID=142586 RepID=UPI00305130E4